MVHKKITVKIWIEQNINNLLPDDWLQNGIWLPCSNISQKWKTEFVHVENMKNKTEIYLIFSEIYLYFSFLFSV